VLRPKKSQSSVQDMLVWSQEQGWPTSETRWCVDVQHDKIDMLNQGQIPIYEPGLKELIDKNVREQRLSFSTDFDTAHGRMYR